MFQPSSAIVRRIAAALMLIAMMHVARSAYAERLNVTDQIEYIGNPYLDRYPAESQTYARNIWDMIAFNGKLYLGAGNSSNSGPAPNAGPVPIISYDPKTNSFASEFVVDEEQVDVMYEFDNKLYIPGHDPKEDWSLGNFYTFSPEKSWKKHRKIPGAIHTFALAMHQGRLYAGLGTKNAKSIAVSSNFGQSWVMHSTGTSRIYDFVTVDDQLFAFGPLYSKTFADRLRGITTFKNTPVLELNDNKFKHRGDLILPDTLFPDTDITPISVSKVVKSTQYKGKSVYIGAKKHNDHQALHFGVYIASSLAEDKIVIEKVPLSVGSIPWDILVKNDLIYILIGKKNENFTEVSVWQSNNTKSWHELFYFEHATFARSFEMLNGNFYFSSGCEFNDAKNYKDERLSQNTGNIIRIKIPETIHGL